MSSVVWESLYETYLKKKIIVSFHEFFWVKFLSSHRVPDEELVGVGEGAPEMLSNLTVPNL